jgi:PKD repeat protein
MAFALMSNRSVDLDGFNWAATTSTSRTMHRPLDYLNGSYTPFFMLDYHVVDITPPHQNYNFSDTTNHDQSVILWDNPSDTDFNHTSIWWDNVAGGLISNASATITKTGLTELTTYTLATKACDLADNCNDFVNYSLTTRADPITTTVNITYNRYLLRDAANSTWYDLRNGTGTTAASPSTQSYSGFLDTGNSPNDGEYKRMFIYAGYAGSTSTFSPGSVIDGGTLTVYGAGADMSNLGVVCANLVDLHPASSTYTALVADDYQTSTWTKLSDDCVTGAVANQSYTFTLNPAGIAYFNTSGPTAVALMSNRSVNMDGYNWALIAASLSSRTMHRPIDYISGSFSPSFSIESHDNGAPANAYAFVDETNSSETNITWTNGGTADFNHTYVMWDNVWAGNLSNTTANFTKSSLTASTSYLFSTKAVDLSGNEAEWENVTVSTTSGTIAPYAAFHSNITALDVGGYVQFYDDSINYPTSWYWELGDGATSTAQNPTAHYTTPGYKAVNLKATNTAGSDWKNESASILVTNNIPTLSGDVSFTPSRTTVRFPGNSTVLFTDISTNTPTSWDWWFGDGTANATTQNVNHHYKKRGINTACLIVTNATGNYSAACQDIRVIPGDSN